VPETKIESLVGEKLAYIDAGDAGDDEILLTTESGRRIQIYHSQDCCESVRILDTSGNWHELIGKVIIEATKEVVDDADRPDCVCGYSDSWTRTDLTFRVDDATVISRWIGESNGYYSESVDLAELTK
jgi:hypothetical protein